MNDTLLALLRRVDTPTVCNAIEVVEGKRGFDAFTRGHVHCTAPGEAIVGYAMTARIAAAAPPAEEPAAIRARRLAYYRAMMEAPKPAIAVVEDMDAQPVGAYWGELNTKVHKALGLSGALTNGVVRDLGDLPEGFPVVAGHIGPSHAFVHVREVATPVTVFGLTIRPGDLVHADRHGAVVIPPAAIPLLEAAIHKLWASERVIHDAAERGFADFAAFETAWAAFERARV